MDFSYTEEQRELQQLASQILTDMAQPARLKALEASGEPYDREAWQQLVVSGIHNAALPEELGGSGMDFLAATLVCEAIGQSATRVPYIPCIISTALPLLAHRDDPVVAALLADIASGKALATCALIEPGNEDPFSPSMRAYRNESWHLSGAKHCIPYAEQASHILLFARAGNELWAGLASTGNAPGSLLLAQQATTGEPQCRLNVEGGVAHCIATGAAAETLLQAVVAMTTVAYCSMAVGVAQRMTRIAAEYTSQRQQFGVPVATFQAVAHRLADCYIDTECLRINTQKAASDVNDGLYGSDAMAMAKVWCGDVMHRVSQATQHVHGGTGIDRDYHLFRFCLWAKFLELALGGSRVHLAQLADRLEARYLAGCG